MEYALLLRGILGGDDLGESVAYDLFGEIMDGAVTPVRAAGLLVALAAKGECSAEIVGAARAMRERSLRVEHDRAVLADVVGTGGDGANTINISTLAALVVAAAGVPVGKHGNRAASGACGSADVLEACGMAIDLEPSAAARLLRETNFTFMYAPRYHPAMRNVAAVRRELGVPTIFNVLGPLTNPARATHQVVGVSRASHVVPMGEVLRGLGVRCGAVVHAASGIDEVAGDGPTTVCSFDETGYRNWILDPAEYGIRAPLESLRGGSVDACKAAFESILGGERSPRADVVALNAALVFLVCGGAATLRDGVELARATLREGHAGRTFARAKALSHE